MTVPPQLPDQPTLADWQAYVDETGRLRGFDKETLHEEFTLLVEEVGELAKAMRKHHGMKMAVDATVGELGHEIADVFWLLTCIANSLDIDLEGAIRSKDVVNKGRVWE